MKNYCIYCNYELLHPENGFSNQVDCLKCNTKFFKNSRGGLNFLKFNIYDNVEVHIYYIQHDVVALSVYNEFAYPIIITKNPNLIFAHKDEIIEKVKRLLIFS